MVFTIRVPCELNDLWRTPPSSGELIRCESNHDIYACSHGGVAMSRGNGTEISSLVAVVRRAWEHVVVSCLVWH
jgi:hypothetical protein